MARRLHSATRAEINDYHNKLLVKRFEQQAVLGGINIEFHPCTDTR